VSEEPDFGQGTDGDLVIAAHTEDLVFWGEGRSTC